MGSEIDRAGRLIQTGGETVLYCTITDVVIATDLSPVKVKLLSSLEGGDLHSLLVLLQSSQEVLLARLHLAV